MRSVSRWLTIWPTPTTTWKQRGLLLGGEDAEGAAPGLADQVDALLAEALTEVVGHVDDVGDGTVECERRRGLELVHQKTSRAVELGVLAAYCLLIATMIGALIIGILSLLCGLLLASSIVIQLLLQVLQRSVGRFSFTDDVLARIACELACNVVVPLLVRLHGVNPLVHG